MGGDSTAEAGQQLLHPSCYRSRPQLERRYLAKPVSAFGLYLVGDTAAVLSIEHHNLLGLRIANRHVAANFKALFEGLWKSGRPAR